MNLKKLLLSSDVIGALASGLCLIHCMITPLIFVAKACSAMANCCSETPLWWRMIDYLFIIISFIAILYATKHTNVKSIKLALWGSWTFLLTVTLSESFELIVFPKAVVYFPALMIVGLHIYNLKYCQCSEGPHCVLKENHKKKINNNSIRI